MRLLSLKESNQSRILGTSLSPKGLSTRSCVAFFRTVPVPEGPWGYCAWRRFEPQASELRRRCYQELPSIRFGDPPAWPVAWSV